MGIEGLAPSAGLLAAGVLLDTIFGDPQVRFHPIRLLGKTLSAYESLLRRAGCDGYTGGILLLIMLTATWVLAPALLLTRLYSWNTTAGIFAHILLIYICFALRDLIVHIRKVQHAAMQKDVADAHQAIGMLVGRDVEKMNIAACCRAAIESLSENFVDGVLSAVFWYVLLGIPGLLLFKVVSTMDSMVGYKSPRYLRFGWCGARLDDFMNFIPARLAWLLLGLFGDAGWRVGLAQHAILPGPNPGWSEATMAGVLHKKLIGPIWKDGQLVTEQWLGDPEDPEAGTPGDIRKAIWIIVYAASIALLLGMISIHQIWR